MVANPAAPASHRPAASPLAGPVRVERRAADRAVSAFTLDPGEPLLAGHYPGFPILPGVCLVECAHRTALATVDDPDAALVAVESARFLGPVFPGDTVHTEVVTEVADGGWRCRAELVARQAGDAGPRKVCVLRLRYGVAAT